MRIKFHLIMAAVVAFVLTSCEVAKQSMVVPPYTSVDKIVNLKQGMTMTDVSKTLGIEAYDVYHIQEDGSSILVYNYRIKDRKTELPSEFNKRDEFLHGEGFQTSGTPYYKMESSKAYILYKDGKMKSVLTDEGKMNSEFLMLINGNLKLLSKEDMSLLNIKKIDDKYVMAGVKDMENTIIQVKDLSTKDQVMTPVLNSKQNNNSKGCMIAGGVLGAAAIITSIIILAVGY